MQTNFTENLKMAEAIAQKIKEDPTCDAVKEYLKTFDQAEQIIIQKSTNVRNRHLDIWDPKRGIINIFENKHFEDPEGLLPLSVRQMQSLKEWTKFADMVSKSDYVNGMVDVATEINGFEVQQKSVGDCSVLSSLAVCGHYELKFNH